MGLKLDTRLPKNQDVWMELYPYYLLLIINTISISSNTIL